MRRRTRYLLGFGTTLLLSLTLALLLSGVRVVTLTSDSMAPTHPTGSRLLAHSLSTPVAGDVVLFETPQAWRDGYRQWRPALAQTPDAELSTMVKRIIAVAGDTVVCCGAGGHLLRNGERLDEPYLADRPASATLSTFTVTVPPGHVWVMGDNRTHSFDSRAAHARSRSGFVPLSAITAVAVR